MLSLKISGNAFRSVLYDLLHLIWLKDLNCSCFNLLLKKYSGFRISDAPYKDTNYSFDEDPRRKMGALDQNPIFSMITTIKRT